MSISNNNLTDDLQKQIDQIKNTINQLNNVLSQLTKNQQNLSTQTNDASTGLKKFIENSKNATNSLKQFSETIANNLKSINKSQNSVNKTGDALTKVADNIIQTATKINENKSSSIAPDNTDDSLKRDSTPLSAVNPNRIEIPAQVTTDTLPKSKELNPHSSAADEAILAHNKNDRKKEFEYKQIQLEIDKQQAIDAAKSKGESVLKVEEDYKQKQKDLDKAKLEAQIASEQKYVDTVSKLSDAVSKIFGKNTVAAKTAFKVHQASAAGQVIIDTQKSIMNIWAADTSIPIVGIPKAIAETAIAVAAGASSLATIWKQKPGFAKGGQFTSDGRGALLPGYSHTDDTNAYLRSGEAVVVSEAMRNPWARNLVSAINVAHGGRDFSVSNPGRGYAIGGIFTDGGNANRYYSQPANDVKDLANTLAYQMINNFPPVYVDVKDINTQQNILAQTINRVNL
jgi:predicted  nucleic acid-binding Zn-ribbon protein